MSAPDVESYWTVRDPSGGHLQCALCETTLGLEMRMVALPAERIVRIRKVSDRTVARAVAREWMAQMLEDGRSGYRIVQMRR